MPFETIGSPILWLGFIVFVLAMLAIDLGVFHRKAHEVSLKEAAVWSAVWVALAAVFNVGVYQWFGAERALEFTAGYLIEKALAVDNIFVFVIIFTAFAVPAIYQHRVLFWGVLGALVMRAVFILAGGAFLQRFHWAIYVFGAILAITGIKLLVQRNQAIHPERNPIVRAFQKIVPVTHEFHGDRFTILRDGRRYATPLLLALVAVEVTDLIFAVDSIPAIFAITSDPFIVFTSNIFAILGLRSLYFLLAGIINKFAYLKIGLSFVLIFVGAKMLLMDVYKVPIGLSLGIIAGILGLSIAISLLRPPRPAQPVER
jgi:tellurite resistance protein TerC